MASRLGLPWPPDLKAVCGSPVFQRPPAVVSHGLLHWKQHELVLGNQHSLTVKKYLRATPTFHRPLRTENVRKSSKIKDSEETDITVKICSSRSIGRQVFRSNGWNQHKFLGIFRKSGNFDFCFSIEIDLKSRNQKKLTSQSKPAHRDL